MGIFRRMGSPQPCPASPLSLNDAPRLYYRLKHVPDIEPARLGNCEAVERSRHDRDERTYLVFVEELQIDVVDVNEVAFVGRVPFKDVATGDDVGEHTAFRVDVFQRIDHFGLLLVADLSFDAAVALRETGLLPRLQR